MLFSLQSSLATHHLPRPRGTTKQCRLFAHALALAFVPDIMSSAANNPSVLVKAPTRGVILKKNLLVPQSPQKGELESSSGLAAANLIADKD